MFMYKVLGLPARTKPTFNDNPTNEKKKAYELVKKVCNYVPHSDKQMSIQAILVMYYSCPSESNKLIATYIIENAIEFHKIYQYGIYHLNPTTCNFYKYAKEALDEIAKLH